MLAALLNFYLSKVEQMVKTLENACVLLCMLCFFYRYCVLAEALKWEVVDITDVEGLN
jgi:hypothetical protein